MKKKEAKIVEETKEVKATKKKETVSEESKKKSRKGLIFLTIVFVILIVLGGTFAWYTRIYKGKNTTGNDEVKMVTKDDKLKFVSYEKGNASYRFLSDYILVFGSSKSDESNRLYAILDSDGKEMVKFDAGFECNMAYTGVDGKLYLEIINEDEETSFNHLELKVLEDGKINNVYSEEKIGYYYTPIVLSNGDLLGYAKTLVDGYEPDEDEVVNNQVYLIENKKKIDCGDDNIVGDKRDHNKIINNSRNYIIVSQATDDKVKYGAIDLKNGRTVLGFDYEELVTTSDDKFVAVKNKKAALITAKLKKILDYEYDFIEADNGFYVVGKDKKMALMDQDYKVFTSYDFDFENALTTDGYDYRVAERGFNSFVAQKYNDKYVLLTKDNVFVTGSDKTSHVKNDVYIIDSDGKYTQIKNVSFDINKGLAYAYDETKKEITIYDENLNEKQKISLKDYDIDESEITCAKYDKIIEVSTKYTSLYFDYETGEEIDNAIYTIELNNLTVNVDLKNQEVIYTMDKKDQTNLTAKLEDSDAGLHYYKDGRFATANNGKLVVAVHK